MPLEPQRDWCCYHAMMPTNIRIPLIGAATAFGAAGAVLALMGVGAPFLLAAPAASACAGIVIYAAMPRTSPTARDHDVAQARIDAIETRVAGLRHDLRGALSPALIMSDRLVESADPAVRRAGEVVVRSIERASALLATAKAELDQLAETTYPPKEDAA